MGQIQLIENRSGGSSSCCNPANVCSGEDSWPSLSQKHQSSQSSSTTLRCGDRQLNIFVCDHRCLSIYRPHLFQASLSPLIVPTVDQPHLSASLATVKNLKMSSLSSSFSYTIVIISASIIIQWSQFPSPSGWQQWPLGPWILGLSDAKLQQSFIYESWE